MASASPIFNNEPWRDEVVFLDESGEPLVIIAPVLIGLRSKWKCSGYDFLVEQDEITIIENVARFEVPLDRMKGLPADAYTLEVGMGAGTDRDIFGWLSLTVQEGINP